MSSVPHVSRRGAVYYWRRRFPLGGAKCRLGVLVIGLGTKEQDVARRIGAELTLMSEDFFELAKRGRLQQEEVKAILVAVAKQHAKKLNLHAVADRARSEPEPMSGERADRIVGAVYTVLSEGGRAAQHFDFDLLQRCGLSPNDATQVDATLAVLRASKLVPPRLDKLLHLLEQHAPEVQPTAVALAQAEAAFYRGMAAALLHTDPRWGATTADDIALLRGVNEEEAFNRSPAVISDSSSPSSPASAAPSAQPELGGSLIDVPTTITGLAEKLAASKVKAQEWTEKTARQMRQSAKLLSDVAGHDNFQRLIQRDFASFRDVLLALPQNYGKSSKDASKPLAKLLAKARELPEEERGVAPPTINRHLTHLGNLIKYAAGYDLNPAQPVDLSKLRAKQKGRDRDDRPPMTLTDMKAIFSLAVWHGCKSETARLNEGNLVIHDALYWVPLIAAHSLARREEICGLMVADVVFDAPIPYFDFRINKYRRLKNPQSKRKVPIHPEVLRLGLRTYVETIAALGYDLLFPDLLSANGKEPLGDQFHNLWAPVLAAAVPDAEKTGKVFHSIRHFGNDALIDAKVMIEWRQDIMGHGGRNETEERYRDETRLNRKLAALKKIPNIVSGLMAVPMSLRANVANRISRQSRLRSSGKGKTAES